MEVRKTGIDMHLHTTASDGVYSPEEVVEKAYNNYLSTIAITDHDTIDGILRALHATKKYGVKVIPGVEFTTNFEPVAHILGLNIDINNEQLQTHLKRLGQIKLRLLAKTLKIVRLNGIDVDAKRIQKEKGTVTILNLKEYLLEQGFTEKGCPLDIELLRIIDYWRASTPSAKECITLIHSCGGIAVLAHPMLLLRDYSRLKHTIIDMKSDGLDGIEVIHPSNSKEEEGMLKEWASDLKLFSSGGSDFHGVHGRVKLANGYAKGGLFIPYDYLERMLNESI